MNLSSKNIPLNVFVNLPDTVSLITRDGFITTDAFMQAHDIHAGTVLSGDYRVDYVDRGQIGNILAEVGENILTMLPIVLGLLDRQSLEASGITQAQVHPYLDLRGRGTLIGFIDTGIDYTLDTFRYEDGTTKIKYIWDQTGEGNVPNDFYFGAEYTEEQINAALKTENPFETVPQRDTVGHGTFLASVAAGRETDGHIGAAPDAEIIAVKLQKAHRYFYEQYLIPEGQEDAYDSADVMLGVQYVINKAAELGRPASICLALGSNMGGHAGLTVLEEYLTRISNITGISLVCAAGNESQAAHHFSARLGGSGESRNIELLAAESGGDIFLSMWNGMSDRMAVSVTSPTGELVPRLPVRSGMNYATNLVLEHSRVSIEYFLPVRNSGDQLTVIKILRATPGIWVITVYGEIVLEGTYHCWLPLTGLGDPGTVFLAPSPNFTIVNPATASGVTACGAYDSRTNSLYAASSWGPTRLPMISPDMAAPGVDVGGLYPAGPGQMSGTSVAAAITAGACALMLQWGIVDGNDTSLTSNRIRASLIRGCDRDAGIEYPNVQWGYGKLNLFNTLNILRPM